MSTFSQFTAGNRIKAIQRGTITMTSSPAILTIASVDTTKAELRMLGFYASSDDLALSPTISLASSTRISADRAASTGTSIISWELTEFI